MAVAALVTITAISVGTALYAGEQQRKAASQAADAQEEQARQAQQRADREEQIARERKEADIEMAEERLGFERESRKEKAEFVTSQMSKQEAELRAAAMAGYASSGIEIEGSALTVLNRITTESEVQKGEVWKDYETFSEARGIEFKQLKETAELGYDWFTSRLHQETQWEISGRHAEAAAYRSKGRYASYGSYLSAAGSLASGYASYSGAGKKFGQF